LFDIIQTPQVEDFSLGDQAGRIEPGGPIWPWTALSSYLAAAREQQAVRLRLEALKAGGSSRGRKRAAVDDPTCKVARLA
jgi:hypothetical protein